MEEKERYTQTHTHTYTYIHARTHTHIYIYTDIYIPCFIVTNTNPLNFIYILILCTVIMVSLFTSISQYSNIGITPSPLSLVNLIRHYSVPMYKNRESVIFLTNFTFLLFYYLITYCLVD